MTNTMNNTLVLNETNTSILDAQGNVISQPVDATLKEVTDFVTNGNSIQHTTFDAQGAQTRKNFIKEFGTDISGVTSMEAALKLSGLDFEVEKVPMYDMDKQPGKPPRFSVVPGHFNVRRTDTRELIGFDVSDSYSIFQNRESFEFLDSLVEDGAEFVNAGLYGGSKRKGSEKPNSKIMICMKSPDFQILGDNYAPYLMFRNGFDQNVSFTCAFVSMRVFCSNCINRALKGATSSISIRHSKTMRDRIEMAHKVLISNQNYMKALNAQAELMALKPFSEDDFEDWVETLIPIDLLNTKEGAILNRKMEAREALMVAYRQPDLDNFSNSAYRAIQAISDYESHVQGQNRGGTTPYSFKIVVENSMPMLNKTWSMLLERA